jgi:hypothetical protein
MSIIGRWEAYYERQQDYERPDFEHSERRVARKEHECSYCHKPIPIGTAYHRIFCVMDGEATADKQCLQCAHGDEE